MDATNGPGAAQFDLVLEAIRGLGATVEQAAYYGGLRPRALLAELQHNPRLQVEVAIARRTYEESDKVA
ncbi:MAG: hypothetical protein NXI31_20900 [bacterium]|nr:hypothetical protein [bacterium]